MADVDTVSRFARRLEIALRDGFFDLAHRIVDQAEQSASSAPDAITTSTSLAALGLPVRTINLLSRAGIDIVGDALAKTPGQLAAIPSIGPVAVRLTRAVIRGASGATLAPLVSLPAFQ